MPRMQLREKRCREPFPPRRPPPPGGRPLPGLWRVLVPARATRWVTGPTSPGHSPSGFSWLCCRFSLPAFSKVSTRDGAFPHARDTGRRGSASWPGWGEVGCPKHLSPPSGQLRNHPSSALSPHPKAKPGTSLLPGHRHPKFFPSRVGQLTEMP